MRLSVTEEFLWDAYSFLKKTEDAVIFVLNPRAAKFLPGIKNPIFQKYKNYKNKIEFNQLLYYLKTKGYIKIKNLEGKKAMMLTKEGIGKALKASFKLGDNKERKDEKWIMLIFDVPQTHQKARNLLKSVLRNLGYKLLQQSVWVTPFDVFEKTDELLRLYSLNRYVKVFLIEKV